MSKFPKLYAETFGNEHKHFTTGIMQVSSQLHTSTAEEDYWDDMQRYRDNQAKIQPYSWNMYMGKKILHDDNTKLIEDPISYENEFKKQNLWSLRDIEAFVKAYLETPKEFQRIKQKLQHKTLKELFFFF